MVEVRASSLRLWLLVGTTLCSPGIARAATPTQPQNGRFVAGSGTIAAGGAQTTVTQGTARGIVDWKSFNVGAGGTVAFQNGNGATLNRVTGNDLSRIAGSITATGSVYLVNPQGVVIAPGGRVITGGGFVASTRPIDPAGFMAGGTTTAQGTSSGDVRNAGTIQAGGDVVLVGRSVSNSGSVTAGGNAALTAADQVTLQVNGGSTRIVVQGGSGNVTNTGSIDAANASLLSAGGNVYALAGKGAGYVNATGTATRNGRVMLVAGGNTEVSGTLTASGPAGAGGTVVVAGTNVALKPTAVVDASGKASGGRVLIGGDRGGGANPAQKLVRAAIPNATTTQVEAGATIKADGGTGAGGSVVVWSNQTTGFAGTISARGGTTPGFAEVSSHAVLNYTGRVDLRSVNGLAGTLLLDPADVYISTAAAPEGASAITPTLLAQQLATANVTITTSGGTGNGDIFVTSPVTWSSASTLTLSAARNVTIRANLTATGAGGVVLAADSGGTGIGTVSFQGGTVALNGGPATIIYNPVSYTAPTNFAPYVAGAVPQALMLVNTPAQVAAIATNTAGTYALGRDIDASTLTGFAGIASFSGVLDGQGHAIANLSVAGNANQAGLFGTLAAGSVVRNLAIANATVGNAAAANAGILAGQVAGSVTNVTTSGSVLGQIATGGLAGTVLAGGSLAQSSSSATVDGLIFSGGLVGVNRGTITNGFASGDVTALNFYVGGLVGYNYGPISNSLSVGNTTGVRSDGALGYDLGPVAANTYYDSSIEFNNLGLNSTRGLTTAQLQAGLPAGFSAATWFSAAGAYPILRGGPGPGVALGGTVYADRAVTPIPGAALGVLIDGTLYEGITAGADGTWTLGVRSAAVSPAGSNVLAALTAGAPGNTLLSGVTGTTGGIDVYGNTLRLVSNQPGAATLSGLLAAQSAAIGSVSWGALLAPNASLAGPHAFDVDLVSRGALAVDQPVSTTGTLLLRAGGAITQTAALTLGGLGLSTQGAVTLANAQNQVGLIAGSVGSLDLAAQGPVTVGSAAGLSGLASAGTLRLTASGTITVNAPVSATGAGDALVLAGSGFTETVGSGALSVAGGGRWLVYLPDPSDVSLSGLSALAYYNTGFDPETRTGSPVAGAGNRFVYQLAPTLTVAANSETVTYNGTTPGTSYSVSGLVGTDTLQQALSGMGSVTGAGAGAGTYTLGVDPGTLASGLNYQLAYQTGTLTVLQKALTGTVANAASTYGTTAVPGAVTLAGVVEGDSVGGTVAIAQGDTPVTLGARTNAGSYTETLAGLTGASAANYTLAPAGNTPGTLTIAPLAISYAVANATATYGTAATPGAAALPGVLAGDSVSGIVAISQSGTPVTLGARTNAGSYAETVSGLTGASAANYTLAPAGNTPGTLTIAPLALSWSVAEATATYGTTAAPGAASLPGILPGDAVSGIVAISQSGTPVTLGARINAGSYAETVSGLTGTSASNYVLAATGNTPGTLTIAPLALSWSVADATATYGTTATPGAASLPGVLSGDAVSGTVVVSQAGVPITLGARTNAGSYAETVSGLTGASASNYVLAGTGNTPGTLTIAPLALSWSVADATATYGTTATPGAASLPGVLSGDAVSGTVVVSQAGIPVTLGTRTNAGSYAENVSSLTGASASNYVLAGTGNTPGTLTIAPLALSWSVADATATYGTTATPGAASLPGVLSGDAVSGTVVVSQSGTPVTLGARTNAGSYAETVSGLTGTSASNYVLAATGNTSGTLTIAPLALSWSVADATATYGTTATPGAASLPGILSGDAVSGIVVVSQAGIPVTLGTRTNAGSYAENVSSLTGASASNYVLAGTGNTPGTLTIAPLAISYAVANATATYGTTAVPGAASLPGILAGDAVSGIVAISQSGVPVTLGARTNAGSYAETVSGLTGASASNYVLAGAGNTPGTLTIAPLALSWSVADATATYGTTATPGAAALPGVLAGDSVSGIVAISQSGIPVTLGTRTNAGSYAETVSTLTGGSAANYTLAAAGNTPGTLTIAPLALSWSVADATATYGTTATPGAAALPGVLPGDTVSGTVVVSQSGVPITLGARTNAGSYAETVSGLTGASAANYTLAAAGNTPGTLTIVPLALSWSVADATATYGTTATPGAAALPGVLAGDSVSGTVAISQSGTPVTLGARTNAGSYAETVSGLTGASAANYTLAATGNTPGTLTIAPLALSWSVADAAATYGTTATPGAASLPGILAGDAVSGIVAISQSGTPVTLGARTNAGSYAETVSSLTGASASNYVLAAAGNTPGTLTIAPLAISYAVANATAGYATPATAGAATLSGVLPGDAVGGVVTISLAGAAVQLGLQTPAGRYAEMVSGLTGPAAANYTVAPGGNTPGTLTINPLPPIPIVPGFSNNPNIILASTSGTGPSVATAQPIVADAIVSGVIPANVDRGLTTSDNGPASAGDAGFPTPTPSAQSNAAPPSNAPSSTAPSDPGPAVAAAPPDTDATGNGSPAPATVSAAATNADPAPPVADATSNPTTADTSPAPSVAAAAAPSATPENAPAASADAAVSAPPAAPTDSAPASTAPMQVASLTPPDAGSAAPPAPPVSGTGPAGPSAAPPSIDAAAGGPAGKATIAAIADAAVQSADAAAAAGISKPAALQVFNARVAELLAAGQSPEAAIAGARQATQQMVAASTRSGPPTPAQLAGDALANPSQATRGVPGAGPAASIPSTAGSAALAAALASGASPEKAMRQAAIATATANAMLALAAAPIPPGAELASSMSAGMSAGAPLRGQAGSPRGAFTLAYAGALAAGKDPLAAQAAAQRAALTLREMDQEAGLPPSAAQRQAGAFAAGTVPGLAAGQTDALARALAAGRPFEEALHRAEAAEEGRSAQQAGSLVPQSAADIRAAALAQGHPAGECGASPSCNAAAVRDSQQAAAAVPVADPELAALAQGRLPMDLSNASPGLRRLLHLGQPRPAGPLREGAAAAPPAVPAEQLVQRLAAGTASPADIALLANGGDTALFTRIFLGSLMAGHAPADAVDEARATVAGFERDAAIPGGQTLPVPADYAGTSKAGAPAPASQH